MISEAFESYIGRRFDEIFNRLTRLENENKALKVEMEAERELWQAETRGLREENRSLRRRLAAAYDWKSEVAG